MPSPRPVLADIHLHKLDPSVAHSKIKANGSLAPHVSVMTIIKDDEVIDVYTPVSGPEVQVVHDEPVSEVETVTSEALSTDEAPKKISRGRKLKDVSSVE